MSPPASPTGSTQPSTTSSTCSDSRLLRSLIRARARAAGLADRIAAAEHDVVDLLGFELVTVLDRAERLRRQIERGHLVQGAVGLAAPARRANGVVDECVGHSCSSLSAVA